MVPPSVVGRPPVLVRPVSASGGPTVVGFDGDDEGPDDVGFSPARPGSGHVGVAVGLWDRLLPPRLCVGAVGPACGLAAPFVGGSASPPVPSARVDGEADPAMEWEGWELWVTSREPLSAGPAGSPEEQAPGASRIKRPATNPNPRLRTQALIFPATSALPAAAHLLICTYQWYRAVMCRVLGQGRSRSGLNRPGVKGRATLSRTGGTVVAQGAA